MGRLRKIPISNEYLIDYHISLGFLSSISINLEYDKLLLDSKLVINWVTPEDSVSFLWRSERNKKSFLRWLSKGGKFEHNVVTLEYDEGALWMFTLLMEARDRKELISAIIGCELAKRKYGTPKRLNLDDLPSLLYDYSLLSGIKNYLSKLLKRHSYSGYGSRLGIDHSGKLEKPRKPLLEISEVRHTLKELVTIFYEDGSLNLELHNYYMAGLFEKFRGSRIITLIFGKRGFYLDPSKVMKFLKMLASLDSAVEAGVIIPHMLEIINLGKFARENAEQLLFPLEDFQKPSDGIKQIIRDYISELPKPIIKTCEESMIKRRWEAFSLHAQISEFIKKYAPESYKEYLRALAISAIRVGNKMLFDEVLKKMDESDREIIQIYMTLDGFHKRGSKNRSEISVS